MRTVFIVASDRMQFLSATAAYTNVYTRAYALVPHIIFTVVAIAVVVVVAAAVDVWQND